MDQDQTKPVEEGEVVATHHEDGRKEWVPPSISELPINATTATIAGIGGDAGIYS